MIPQSFLCLLVFEWYLLHVCPGAYFGDCGEILSAVFTNGIPHPTGFPTYLLLVSPFSQLGKTPFWVNVFSAVSASLAIILLIRAFRRLTGDPIMAYAAGLLLVSSSTLMVHSATARIYTLNLLLFVVMVYLSIRPELTRAGALRIGLIAGLGLGTHFVFLAGPMFFVLMNWRRRSDWRALAPWLASGTVLSMSLYLWIPFRSNLNPDVNWGEPSSWIQFVRYITQQGYQNKMFARDIANTALFIKTLMVDWGREWPVTHWLLAFAGGLFAWRRHAPLFRATIAIIMFNILLLGIYGLEKDLLIAYRYFLPTYALAAILGAFGLKGIVDRYSTESKWTGRFLLVVLAVFATWNVHPWRNLSRSMDCHDYALDTLKPLMSGTVLELKGDNGVFPVAYARYALRLRPDLKLIEWEGTLFPEVAKELRRDPALTRARVEERLFREAGEVIHLPEERSVIKPLLCEQNALAYRLTTVQRHPELTKPPDLREFFRLRSARPHPPDEEGEEVWAHIPLARARDAYSRENREEALIRLQETCQEGAHVPYALINASSLYSNLGEDTLSENNLKHLLTFQPNHMEAHLNLGILYGKMARYRESLVELNKALALDPANPVTKHYLSRVQNLLH